jgi:hypothetical protein
MSTKLCKECDLIFQTLTKSTYGKYCCYPSGDCDFCGKEIASFSGGYLVGDYEKPEAMN